MKQADIQRWLGYWRAAKVANFGEIHSEEDMHECRRFVPEMARGVFWNVSDKALWEALCDLRGWEFHEAECRSAAIAYLEERARA